MKHLFFLFFVQFMFASCTPANISFTDQRIYMLEDNFNEIGFFLYPKGAELVDEDSVVIGLATCDVVFDNTMPVLDKNISLNTKVGEFISFSSVFVDNVLVTYFANIVDSDYVFYVNNNGKDVRNCIYLVDSLANSFSFENSYENSKFSYTVDFFPDFEVVNFVDGGFFMKEVIDDEKIKDEYLDNSDDLVEISVVASFESMQINDYIYSHYEGYTIEFEHLGILPVSFVDEVNNGVAVRRCFIFNNGVMYEFILKVPSLKYSTYKPIFDDFCFSFSSI